MGLAPPSVGTVIGDYIHVSTDVTQISITIPPRSMVLYHNYFRKMLKMRAPGRPEPPRHSRTSLALKIDTFSSSFVRGLRLSQLLFFISFVAFMASLLHRLHELHVAMLAYTPFVSDHNSRRTKYCIPRNVKWWWCWWWWW